MICPKCETSEVWENDEKVAQGWKGPLRKCKDPDCGWIQWPPKEKKAAPRFEKPPQAAAGTRADDLTALFWQSFDEVLAGLRERKLTDLFVGKEVAALTATLFIQRAKG